MTYEVSEKQAYYMGWMYKADFEEEFKIVSELFETDMEFYRYCSIDSLDDMRFLDFVRGVMDRRGIVRVTLNVTIPVRYVPTERIKIPYDIADDQVVFRGINGIEFIASLYANDPKLFSATNYQQFLQWAHPQQVLPHRFATFNWSRKDKSTPAPSKNKFTDSGYDLHLISKIREVNGVHYFDTGITVEPETGYYMEIVGRSSISKSGWMLANNIGIIDTSYRGSIIVALVKINPDAPDFELPARMVQMIPRQLILLKANEINEVVADTSRGVGGFGSSGI